MDYTELFSKVVFISPDGTVTDGADITEALSGRNVKNIAALPNGEYAVYNGNGNVIVISSDGTPLYEAEIKDFPRDNIGTSMILTADGEPAVSYAYVDMLEQHFKTEICILDTKSEKFGKKTAIEGNGTAYAGNGQYSYYISSDTGIYGVSENGTSEKIVNLLNLGIDVFNAHCFCANDDGSFTIGLYDVLKNTEESENGFVKVSPVENAETEGRKLLTLGCFKVNSDVQAKISEFNRHNKDYLIVASSFSENNPDDYDAALIDFNFKLISGDIPDIVMINKEMPFESYVRKGLFTDLYPYLDNDDTISRDDFFDGVLRSNEINGKLYAMAPTFNLETFAAKGSVVGDDKLLTMEMAKQIVSSMGEDGTISLDINRSDALRYAVLFSGLIDFENSTCNFDSDEFRKILNDIKEFPEKAAFAEVGTPEYLRQQTSYMEGRTLITPFNSFVFLTYYDYRLKFDGDIAYVNFPTCSPATNAVIVPNERFAVSAKSEYKDGAWEFVRDAMYDNIMIFQESYYNEQGDEILTDEHEYFSLSYPSNRKEYDLITQYQLRNYHEYDENGNITETLRKVNFIGTDVEGEHMTEKEVSDFTEVINNCTVTDRLNSQIMTIINEEADAFFAGASDADTASKNIQSRMTIYLNE